MIKFHRYPKESLKSYWTRNCSKYFCYGKKFPAFKITSEITLLFLIIIIF